MRILRVSHVLLLGAALSSTACMAQVALPKPGFAPSPLPTPSEAPVSDTGYCQAISDGGAQLAPLTKLCEFALSYLHELPDFISEQTTTENRWGSITVVNAQVTFLSGRESYSAVTVNGKPAQSGSFTDRPPVQMTFVSSGEFGSFLVDLFKPPIVTKFTFRKEARLQGIPVAVYEFDVPAASSFWTVRDSRGRVLRPEFRGEIWLEQATGRLLRTEMQPVHMPGDFEAISIRTATDYDLISLGEAGAFVLPVKSETDVCLRWSTSCAKNVMAFHNYRKFSTTSRIVADLPEP